MLPHYPNHHQPRRRHHHHHHHQQAQPFVPNPTAASAFLMPAAASSWDGYGGQIFPAADMYSNQQGTLEAVLRQRVTAPPRQQQDHHQSAAAVVRESSIRDGAAALAHGGAVAVARRRPLRTDRHSKIRTAQGVRDRRMRLSVGVARDFFALQDRLGFDKGSKTVSWLLMQSRPAIDRLFQAASTVPGAAPCFGPPEGSSMERVRSRGGVLDPPAALTEDRGGGSESDLDWNMPQAAAATELAQPMDGLEYYYQLEQMMGCNNGVLPR